jgi:hypothetical protein
MSTTTTRLPLATADEVAAQVLELLKPHCERIDIAGSSPWFFAALLRHLFAWWRGEELDPESGLSHLAHAGCCLMFLMEYRRNGWGTDDRFKVPDAEPFQKHDGVKG